MSDKDDILDAIRRGIGRSIPVAVSSQNAVFDLFEVYVLDLFLSAAQQKGATIRYEDIDGNMPGQLLFRTSPGWIYRKSARTPAFTHAVLEFPNAPALEVHLGVYVAGESSSLHELDVAVIDRSEAQLCRARRISPRHTCLLLGAECKFYTNSRIKLAMGRAFFGLTGDFPQSKLQLVTNIESRSVEFFLNKKKKETDFGVLPGNPDGVGKFVEFLKRLFHQYQITKAIRRAFTD